MADAIRGVPSRLRLVGVADVNVDNALRAVRVHQLGLLDIRKILPARCERET